MQRERGLNRNETRRVSDTWKCGSLSFIFTHPPEVKKKTKQKKNNRSQNNNDKLLLIATKDNGGIVFFNQNTERQKHKKKQRSRQKNNARSVAYSWRFIHVLCTPILGIEGGVRARKRRRREGGGVGRFDRMAARLPSAKRREP